MAIKKETRLGIDDVTNGTVLNNEWAGTGVFDKLITALNKNIDLQYQKGRIKGSDYANVYLGAMQSVLQSSIQYSMAEKEAEAKIDIMKQQLLTEIENTANTGKQGLLLDKDALLKDEQISTSQKQLEILDVEKDVKLAQEAEILSGTVRATADLSDKHLTTAKQRELVEEQITSETKKQILLDTEEEAKQYEVDNILFENLTKIQKENVLLTAQTTDVTKGTEVKEEQIRNLYVERISKDKDAAAKGMDNVIRTTNTYPEEVYTPKYEA